MGSDPNNKNANTVHTAASDSTIVQTESVQNLTVGIRDRRTVLLLALTLVVVVVAATLIVWLVREPDEPKLVGDPLAAVASLGLECSSPGWVQPDPGTQPIPYAEQKPPDAVLGSGGFVTATVQGVSELAVVLQSMRAEVISRRPAVAGVLLPRGCAGDVEPKYFSVNLSAAVPTAVPLTVERGGQQYKPKEFPFKVASTDVEQFKIRVDSSADDVEWVLWMRWSAGARSGEFRIDDNGKPFRTTASAGLTQWCAYSELPQAEWRPSCA